MVSRIYTWGVAACDAALASINVALFIWAGHHWYSLVGAGAILAILGGYLYARYQLNRRKSCSTSQQPTSGTSQSPDPLNSPNAREIVNEWRLANPNLSFQISTASANPSPPEPEQSIPTSRRTMPVIGYRAWNVREDFKLGVGVEHRLTALNGEFGHWEVGGNAAECKAQQHPGYAYGGTYIYGYRSLYPAGPTHPTPSLNCHCGFWVLSDLDRVPFRPGVGDDNQPRYPVVGAVLGWGRVIQHADVGWRAEKAQVIALLDCRYHDDQLALTERVAEAYGVPVLSRDALELYVKEFGDRFPPEASA